MSDLRNPLGLSGALTAFLAATAVCAAQPDGGLFDPTRPAGWHAPRAGEAEVGQRPARAFRLQGTFNVAGKRSAMISGRRVTVGDQISGAEVLAIERNRVVLRVDGETLELAEVVPGVKAPASRHGELR